MDEPSDGARAAVRDAVRGIRPFDASESDHRLDALGWIRSGAEIFRTAEPDVPPKHLVSYCALVDPRAEAILLVDHRNARRWLATGGHVDVGEHPYAAARREMAEELGVDAPPLAPLGEHPLFVTTATTFGLDSGHVDVSLWYVFARDRTRHLRIDPREVAAADWWTFDAVRHAAEAVDPNLPRFVAKLADFLAPAGRR